MHKQKFPLSPDEIVFGIHSRVQDMLQIHTNNASEILAKARGRELLAVIKRLKADFAVEV